MGGKEREWEGRRENGREEVSMGGKEREREGERGRKERG